MVLAQAERRLTLAEKLAAVSADPRDPLRLVHRPPEILRARILAIACGYGCQGSRSAALRPRIQAGLRTIAG